jgi:hypothetical protein
MWRSVIDSIYVQNQFYTRFHIWTLFSMWFMILIYISLSPVLIQSWVWMQLTCLANMRLTCTQIFGRYHLMLKVCYFQCMQLNSIWDPCMFSTSNMAVAALINYCYLCCLWWRNIT